MTAKKLTLPHGIEVLAFEWQPYVYLLESNAAAQAYGPHSPRSFEWKLGSCEEILIQAVELFVSDVGEFDLAAIQVVLIASQKECARVAASKCDHRAAFGGYVLPVPVHAGGLERIEVQVERFPVNLTAKFRLLLHTLRKNLDY